MREIKFRVWDGKTMNYDGEPTQDWLPLLIDFKGHVCYPSYSDYDGNKPCNFRCYAYTSNSKYGLMQYTGLKDQNEKEIYEGDIVIFKNSIKEQLKGIIKFKNGAFGYDCKNGFYQFPLYKATKIIGNKFENPKLLKEMK